MISFKAKVINYPKIDILGKNNKYKKQEVTFIELDCRMDSDVECIKKVSEGWNYGNTFAKDIYASMTTVSKKLAECDYFDFEDKRQFFAITKQQYGFLNLNPKKIIALAEVDKDYDYPYNELKFLQVKPSLKKGTGNKIRKIKNIGKTLVNSILQFYNETIVVEPIKKAIGFYSKLGFQNGQKIRFPGFLTDKTMVKIKKGRI